jgi:hypothetical protein
MSANKLRLGARNREGEDMWEESLSDIEGIRRAISFQSFMAIA